MATALRPRFFESNFIDVRCLQDYSLRQSDTTRLSFDADYPSVENPCYFTAINRADVNFIQFRTEYDSVTAILVDENDNETDISSAIGKGVTFENGTVLHELVLNISALSGYHYIKFNFDQDFDKPELNYQTEWFNISTDAELKYYQLVECYNQNFAPYDDGMIWGAYSQKIYIFSTTVDTIPSTEQSVFTTEYYTIKTTQEQPIRSKLWKIDLIPDYLLNKLVIFMAHEYFKIDGVRYNREGGFDDSERQGETRLYAASKELRIIQDAQGNRVEDYSQDQIIEGDTPVVSPFALYAGEGAALYADTGAAIGYE